MTIRNVVFDVGGVLLEWDPPSVIARLYPDAGTQAVIRQQMFEHPDWLEFDRGALSYTAPSSISRELPVAPPTKLAR